MPKRNSTRTDLTPEDVYRYLDYDPETGIFSWRERHDIADKRTRNSWNAKYAGKAAGGKRLDGYLQIGLYGRHYLAHRLAWLCTTGEWPPEQIDHINCNPGDNRAVNLRSVSPSENVASRRVWSEKVIPLKGVTRNHKRFMARITRGGKSFYLGTFDTPEEAYAVYVEAGKRLYGASHRPA